MSGIGTSCWFKNARGKVFCLSECFYVCFEGSQFLLDDAAILQVQPEEADSILFIADMVKIVGKLFQLATSSDVTSFEMALLWQTTTDHHTIRAALNRIQDV